MYVVTFRSTPEDGVSDAIARLRGIDPSFRYVATSSVPGTGDPSRHVPNDIVVDGYAASDGRTMRARVSF